MSIYTYDSHFEEIYQRLLKEEKWSEIGREIEDYFSDENIKSMTEYPSQIRSLWYKRAYWDRIAIERLSKLRGV